MATKLQLKQRCKELADALELLNIDNEHHKLNMTYARDDKERFQREAIELRKNIKGLRDVGSHVMYEIAYDLAANRTHRERNNAMRTLFAILKDAIENPFDTSTAEDIIPY